MTFADRYGPWALIAGGSEGIGAAFARGAAARGLSVILLARRQEKLAAIAEEIAAAHPVQVHTASVDLGAPDVAAQVAAAIGDRRVGLLVYNACYSPIGSFLDVSLRDKLTVLDVNCRGPVTLCDDLGRQMVARGRGGIVLMSSMSGFQGSAMVGTYAASKAFNTILGESLWEELSPHGVDVLVCAAGATLTPNFQTQTPATRQKSVFPMTSASVAEGALDRLGSGPTFIPGRLNRMAHVLLGRLLSRRGAVRFISKQTRRLYAERTP